MTRVCNLGGVGVPCSGFTEVNRGRSPVGVFKVSMRDLRKQVACWPKRAITQPCRLRDFLEDTMFREALTVLPQFVLEWGVSTGPSSGWFQPVVASVAFGRAGGFCGVVSSER